MAAPGTFRPAAVFASCAAEPCDNDATVEALHAPAADVSLWVPLCPAHQDAILRGDGLQYVLEVHGFVPAIGDLP